MALMLGMALTLTTQKIFSDFIGWQIMKVLIALKPIFYRNKLFLWRSLLIDFWFIPGLFPVYSRFIPGIFLWFIPHPILGPVPIFGF